MNTISTVIKKLLLLLLVLAFITPVPVYAHVIGGRGLSSGITHPFTGVDHILVMIVVGIISRRKGGNFTWLAPILFIVCMILGAVVGLKGIRFMNLEPIIALSVLLSGLLISHIKRIHSSMVFGSIVLVALVHGHVHGIEAVSLVQPIQYILGFTLSTSILHLSGALFADYVEHDRRMLSLFRFASFVVSFVGMYLLKTSMV
jgi:urease accessory protein